jgi:hypothetical protein
MRAAADILILLQSPAYAPGRLSCRILPELMWLRAAVVVRTDQI